MFARSGKTKPLDLLKTTRPKSENTPGVDGDVYSGTVDHLLDEFRWLNRILAAHVLRLRRANFFDQMKDFKGFFIADEEIDALFASGVFEANDSGPDSSSTLRSGELLEQARSLRSMVERQVQTSIRNNVFLPIAHLRMAFALSDSDAEIFTIALAPQIDARYGKIYAYLQNDITRRSPSIDLVLALLCSTPEERMNRMSSFHPSAPLNHFHLVEGIEVESGSSSVHLVLRVDRRLVQFVLGSRTVDQSLVSYLKFPPSMKWDDVVVPAATKDTLLQSADAMVHKAREDRPVVFLHGKLGVGKKASAGALCGEVGVGMGVVDVRSLLMNPEVFEERLQLILREGLLQPCALYFDHIEALSHVEEKHPAYLRALADQIRMSGWLVFIGSEELVPPELLDIPTLRVIEIPSPDFTLQKALWETHLKGLIDESESLRIDDLTVRFELTGGQIRQAVRAALASAQARGKNAIGITDLMASSRSQSQPRLLSLARKIEPRFRWGDLVLPVDQVGQLREIVSQVENRQQVLNEWGFQSKLALGRGLNALFGGPSGTGKTMAAEIIASALSLDLYKIDLSAVVSKYIGETEKNLNRVFTEAEHSNAILFFDEADALFGKRSEVRDSHDRYANIEIAYLLQKMEEYEGITILATNLRQNLDDAFTRRMRFIIEFPFPDEQYRLAIWKGIWPAGAPLGPDVDLELLARQFRLTGGNIRNVALSAAFLASSNGQVIEMKHLFQALRREFGKMGKLLRDEELSPASK